MGTQGIEQEVSGDHGDTDLEKQGEAETWQGVDCVPRGGGCELISSI